MAFTRKMLKAMGIEDEKIDMIMEAHADVVDALKAYKDDAETLKTVQKELDDLKKEDWKKKYEDEHSAFESYKTSQSSKETEAKKKDAYKALLKETGISEKRIDSVMRVSDLKGIDLDDSGKIKDADKVKETIKKDWSDFIVQRETQGARTPNPSGTSTGTAKTKEEIYKKDDHGRYVMSASERQKALAEAMASSEE